MTLLRQEHFLCESKDVDIFVYQINGKLFFNATKVWQNFGSPDVLALDVYLRNESAKKLMIQMYGNLQGFDKLLNEINDLSQNLSMKGFKFTTKKPIENSKKSKVAKVFEPFEDTESFLTATHMIRLKKIGIQFEDGFVHSTKGAQGATFLCYDLFLDYCTHLSTQLKLQVFETFKKFGDLTKLEGQSLIDALQRKIEVEKSKLPTFTSQIASKVVREEVKEKTKNLHQAIQDVFHVVVPPTKEYNMYAYIHDEINTKLFGASSATMYKIMEIKNKSKLRDYMTDKAIRLLEQVESSIYVFLSDCYDAKLVPPSAKLKMVIESSCNSALSIARLIKDDFLILQKAVERDYDLLVKNADCVKNVGVVARPDEICEKTQLIPKSNDSKRLVDEKMDRKEKTIKLENRQTSTQLSLPLL